MKKIKAIFVSVWDGGTVISTSCMFNPKTNDATDIVQADVSGMDLETLDEQYVELPNGEKITEFTIDGEFVPLNEEQIKSRIKNGTFGAVLSDEQLNRLERVVDKYYNTPDQDQQ